MVNEIGATHRGFACGLLRGNGQASARRVRVCGDAESTSLILDRELSRLIPHDDPKRYFGSLWLTFLKELAFTQKIPVLSLLTLFAFCFSIRLEYMLSSQTELLLSPGHTDIAVKIRNSVSLRWILFKLCMVAKFGMIN